MFGTTRAGRIGRAGVWMGGLVVAVMLGAGLTRLSAAEPAIPTMPPESPAEFDSWYQQQLGEANPKDSTRLYNLALSCWTNKHADKAAEVCRKILATWPDHAKAKALLKLCTQHLAASRPASQPGWLTSRPASSEPVPMARVLTPEGINRLRFAEFCFKDMKDRPRVVIQSGVDQEFLAEVDKTEAMTPAEKAQFRASESDDKLRWIVLHTGMRYVDRVQLMTDPLSLTEYRQKVWPILSKNCGTPACHGGEGAGRLRLVLPPSLPAVGATNFYTIVTLEGQAGQVVNREHPEASLLLQYGLPTDQTEIRHPTAIRPLFVAGTNDPKYRVVMEWIQSLRKPAMDYGLTDRMWQPMGPRAPILPAGH